MTVSGNQDKAFVGTFAGVLGILVAFTFAIITIAVFLTSGENYETDSAAKATAERIAPIGSVITDASQLAKPAAAPHAPLSGDQVVAQVCSACHGAGVLGAPKIGDKSAWGPRLKEAGSVDGLVAVATKGKGSMPPRGGNPDLSDAELKGAIEQMLKQTGL
jgi:cytochrome c5